MQVLPHWWIFRSIPSIVYASSFRGSCKRLPSAQVINFTQWKSFIWILLLGIANPSQNKAELQVSMIIHVRGHQWLMRHDFEMFLILSPYLYFKHISYLPVTLGFLAKQKKVSLSVSLIYKTSPFPLFISSPVCAVQLTEISLLSAPINVLICHCTSSVSTR